MSLEGPSRASAFSSFGARSAPEPTAAGDLEEYGFESNSKRRQQLISFGHSQWGFKNWNWSVSKQELDFVDNSNGTHCAGAVSYVSIAVNSLGLNRQNIGYATASAPQKGIAICKARKESVTNALCETLLSFGGSVAVQLTERLESFRLEERNNRKNHFEKYNDCIDNVKSFSNITSAAIDSKNSSMINSVAPMTITHRKDSSDSSLSMENNHIKGVKSPQRYGNNQLSVRNASDKPHNNAPINNNSRIIPQQNMVESTNFPANHSTVKPTGFNSNQTPKTPPGAPPSAMVAGNMRPNAGPVSMPQPHHASNVSYLVRHVMPPLYSVQCAAPHAPAPSVYHNTFFTEIPSWPVYDNYERHQNKVNFNMPPKNFVMNGRNGTMECQPVCGGRSPPIHPPESDPSTGPNNYIGHPFNMNGSWIKPTIFYDGFWTEQQMQKWVAEQMDKSPVIEESRTASPSDTQKQMCHSKV